MAFGVTITIVPKDDGTCAVEPASPVHVPPGATITFENLTATVVTIYFEPPLPPASITLVPGEPYVASSPQGGPHNMSIPCWPPDKAGPKLIIDEPLS